MAKLTEITTWLDDYLKTDSIQDYPNAYNGLQVENSGEIHSVGSAVDASLKSIRQAVDRKVDLLIVHHGLYWQGVEMLKGAWKEKCELLLENNIALYSSHLPLDVHPKAGNNVLLAQALGLKEITQCLPQRGINMAVKGYVDKNRDAFIQDVEKTLGKRPFYCLEGKNKIDELYIMTGGAGTEITKINEVGGKNFLSGEGSHWTIPYAEEQKMNYILATHYLTETLGVERISEEIKRSFSIERNEKIREKCFL